MTERRETSRSYRQVRFERPRGSTEIYLVRHGESASTDLSRPFPLVDGRGDPPLSDLGHAQAEAVAQRLGGVELEAIYVTQLRRTSQTAAPLAAATGLTPVLEPDLVEISMGEWEGGLYRKRIAERHPLLAEVLAEQRWDVIPGAESNESLTKRTSAAIRRITEAHPDGRVVVFSHAVAISSVLADVTGAQPFAFVGTDNASISVLVADSERVFLRRFNDTTHVEHLRAGETG